MSNTTRKVSRQSRSNLTKVVASLALVAGAASVAGLGTFGAFTSTTSASESVASGKVTIGTGAPARSTDIPATGLVPGDTVQRAVTLTRANDSEQFGSVRLTTAATGTATKLTTDATNGLQLNLDQCTIAWTKAPTTDELLCAGTTTAVITKRAVVGSALDMPAATTALNGSSTSHLRVTLALPTDADNTFQGLSTAIGFTFDATQRAGQFK